MFTRFLLTTTFRDCRAGTCGGEPRPPRDPCQAGVPCQAPAGDESLVNPRAWKKFWFWMSRCIFILDATGVWELTRPNGEFLVQPFMSRDEAKGALRRDASRLAGDAILRIPYWTAWNFLLSFLSETREFRQIPVRIERDGPAAACHSICPRGSSRAWPWRSPTSRTSPRHEGRAERGHREGVAEHIGRRRNERKHCRTERTRTPPNGTWRRARDLLLRAACAFESRAYSVPLRSTYYISLFDFVSHGHLSRSDSFFCLFQISRTE